MIERIEVYKGVLPAELSEDALGGGINVVLKKDMQNNIATSYSYGSFNTHQWDLNASYRNKESGFVANLSSFYNYTDNNYNVWGENVYVTDNSTGIKKYIIAKRFHDSYYSSGIKDSITHKKWADELLLASAERAIRLPGITEMLGNTSENIDPSPLLRPENSRNLNVGFNIGNFDFGKNEFGAEANFFVRDIHDMIQRGAPRNTADFYSFENLGKVLSKGVDLELRYNWDKKLFVNIAGSYFDARFNLQYNEYGVEYFYYKSRLRNVPYLTGNANAKYIFRNIFQEKSRLSLNYNFGYTHEFFKDWENLGSANKIIIPTQALHDLGVTYTFPNRKWTLAVNAKNIFDTQVFDNYALQKPGRAIFGKVTYSVF